MTIVEKWSCRGEFDWVLYDKGFDVQ